VRAQARAGGGSGATYARGGRGVRPRRHRRAWRRGAGPPSESDERRAIVMEIQEIRKRIDEADEQLVQAFAKRMRAAADIADYKREHGLPVWDPAREREVMARQTQAAGEDMAMDVKLLYNTIFDISRSYQQRRLHRGGELGNRIARAIEETPKTFTRQAVV